MKSAGLLGTWWLVAGLASCELERAFQRYLSSQESSKGPGNDTLCRLCSQCGDDCSSENKGSYTCDADESSIYRVDDILFELKCGYGTHARELGSVPCASLKQCADICAGIETCQSCDWAQDLCNLKGEYMPTFPAPYMTWFPLAPRGCPYPRLTAAPEVPDFVLPEANISCPDDDGKYYESPTGDFFLVQCCTKPPSPGGTEISTTNIRECVDRCAQDEVCRSVSYTKTATDDEAVGLCRLLSGEGFQTQQDPVHHYIHTVDPPHSDVPHALTKLCSSDCPFADGQQYISDYGEAFHIDCAKRHGAKTIYQDVQPTLKDCMDSCAQIHSCHSVDWNAKSHKCYYGQDHGEPRLSGMVWQSAHSMGCTGACKEGCTGTNRKPSTRKA